MSNFQHLGDAVFAARTRRRPVDHIARHLAASLNGSDQGEPEAEAAPVALNSPKLKDIVLDALNTAHKEK